MKELKELIKTLASEQIELKAGRKTGSNPDYEKRCASNNAASKVRRNKPKITAAHNLMHELRGSDYRHGLPDDWDWLCWYRKDMEALRAEFAAEPAAE
jgi:hypothetical protein